MLTSNLQIMEIVDWREDSRPDEPNLVVKSTAKEPPQWPPRRRWRPYTGGCHILGRETDLPPIRGTISCKVGDKGIVAFDDKNDSRIFIREESK